MLRVMFWGIIACCVMLTAHAGEPQSAALQTVRVGFYYWDGYHQQSQDGIRSGYGYDYLQRIAAFARFRYEYIGYEQSWAEMFAALDAGTIDLLTCVQKNPERLEKYDFSQYPIGESSTVLTVAKDSPYYPGEEYTDWNGICIGMIEASSHNPKFIAFAQQHGLQFVPVYYQDLQKMNADLLAHRNIDAVLSNNLRDISQERLLLSMNPEPFYIVVKKGNERLMNQVNQALKSIQSITPSFSNHLWSRYYAKNNCDVLFSEDEFRFIRECHESQRKIPAILMPDAQPYSYFEHGKAQGILSEIVQEIIERSGLPIEIVNITNRQTYQEALAGKQSYLILDAWNNAAQAEARDHFLTEPYLSLSISRIHRQNTTTELRVAISSGSPFEPLFRQNCAPESIFIYYDTFAEAIQAIQDGEADVCYAFTGLAERILQRDASGVLAAEVVPGQLVNLAISIPASEDSRFHSILTKSIQSIPEGNIAAIQNKYLKDTVYHFSFQRFLRENFMPVLTVILGALLLLALVFAYVLFSRRAIFRQVAILHTLPLRYFVSDRNGNILQYSLGNQVEFQKNKHPFQTIDDLPDPLVNQSMKQAMIRSIDSGMEASVDFDYQKTKRTALVCKLPDTLFGRPCAIWISQDTTILQHSKAEVEAQRQLFEEILNNIPAYIVVKDLNHDFRYIFWNDVALKFNGLNAADVVGKKDSEIPKYHDYVALFHQEDMRVLGGEILDVVKPLQQSTGEVRQLRTIITSAKLPNGHCLELVLGLDVTELKNLEAAQAKSVADLKEYADQAQAAARAKSMFLATMSHEIRTPLNAVIGFSEVLKDETLPPALQKSYLNDISVAGNALLSLINDVLDLSKLESGKMEFTPSETNFPELVNEVATIFQQRFRDKKLQNIVQIAPMPTLLIDKLRMRQILFNLVGNAVKFTEHGHIEFQSTFTPQSDTHGTLCFSISDTGCGISEEDQQRIFQPFAQSNAIRGTQVAQNGTGLGLTIIRRMLERLNGEISLQSVLGQGTTFTVKIHHIEYLTQPSHACSPSVVAIHAQHPFSGCVLIVDDVVLNLKVTQAMLKQLGIASELANGAAAALALLAQNKDITVVFSDLWMPGMNGDALACKIRTLYPERPIKIIAVTADTERTNLDLGNFDGILHKPVNLAEIQKILKTSDVFMKPQDE